MTSYTGVRQSVEFKAERFDILERAAKQLGYRAQRGIDYLSFNGRYGRVTVRDGRIDIDERDSGIIDQLKHQYSREVNRTAAQRGRSARRQAGQRKQVHHQQAPMALTKRELDHQGCSVPGCTEAHGGPMFLQAGCHPKAGVEVQYLDGIITLRCNKCERNLCEIAVQNDEVLQ